MERSGFAAPAVDDESRFYWEGLRRGKLLLQRCESCSRTRFPPMPSCPYCAATQSVVVELPPAGTVYSWVVVHRALSPTGGGDLPYVIAVIDLAGGCRTVARLDGVDGAVCAGMVVEGHFVDHGDWAELRFHPVTGAGG